MENYLYLIINLSAIFIPIIFSFHKRLNFHHHFRSFILGFFFMFPLFMLWDVYFTKIGVWGFNSNYLMGFSFYNLPIEECLFFLCIPFSCIFTYHVVFTLSKNKADFESKKWSLVVSIIFLVFGLIHYNKMYTLTTFILLSIVIFIAPYFVNMRIFFKTFLILQIPFFMVNGVLTGSIIENQVVWYNNNENLSIRLGTIPIEDVFYALLMLLLVMIGYQLGLKRQKQNAIS